MKPEEFHPMCHYILHKYLYMLGCTCFLLLLCFNMKHEADKELLLGTPLSGCSKKALLSFMVVLEFDTASCGHPPLLDYTCACLISVPKLPSNKQRLGRICSFCGGQLLLNSTEKLYKIKH